MGHDLILKKGNPMSDMNELIEWLQAGIESGHITSEEAFKWVARRAESEAPSRLRPIAPTAPTVDEKPPRLKKDGTPWGKPGRKKRQTEIPGTDSTEAA